MNFLLSSRISVTACSFRLMSFSQFLMRLYVFGPRRRFGKNASNSSKKVGTVKNRNFSFEFDCAVCACEHGHLNAGERGDDCIIPANSSIGCVCPLFVQLSQFVAAVCV